MLNRRQFAASALFALGLPAPRALGQAGAPIVAAASDLQFALPDVARAFTERTGEELRLVFGSTGNFARQIRAGAPFELFLAADESYVLALADQGLTLDRGSLYALGRIVLVAPPTSILKPDPALDNLERLLAQGRITRFAIANPDHAPYGARAREALIARGLWQAVQPALVLGENVSQAAQFALSGNAEGGIIALSLAMAPDMRERARQALIPAEWHSPLRQRMALLRGAGQVARDFHDFMHSPPARQILSRHGFSLPDGES